MFRKTRAPHLKTGTRGERAARRFLRLRGYRILERNYKCPLGEIDIVALKGAVLVFVEVRTRQPGALVDPLSSINDMKLAHIVEAAGHYLTARRKGRVRCRFDIITVLSGGPLRGRVLHYRDAFRVADERPERGKRLRARYRMRPRF